MPEVIAVLMPLLNPNEPEALLVAVNIKEGQAVAIGDVLCTLETTKSAADLLAESDGYVAGLKFWSGQTARAGDLLCYLSPDPDWQAPSEPAPTPPASSQPANLRITQPALSLARQYDLDLSHLPEGEFITESRIRELLGQTARAGISLPKEPFNPAAIVIYGGGDRKSVV